MSRRWLWTLLATAAILPFVGLGHPLWEVDDARYAEVPREMVERGDWLTPRLDYLDYVEKPPLPYWLTCVSYSVFHVSEASARLPLALWALAALAGTATLGAWLFGAEIGLASALILATTAAFLGLSHVLTPDLPLSAVLVWTMALWLRAMRRPEDAPWASAAAGACMALAVLCKGLVGVVFPVAWTAALALFFPELRPGYKRSLAGWLIPLFLLIAAPWFLLMERLHPGFFGFFFGEQHFQRFMSGAAKYRRYGPWWYFFPVDLAATLPWTPALGAAALALVRPGERGAPPPDLRLARQLGLWVLGVFAFFSLSSSKLPTYILPLMPQQAVLAAWILLRAEGAPQSWVRGLAFGLGITLVLALPALGPALARVEGAPLPAAAVRLAVAALGCMAAATLASTSSQPRRRLALGAVGAAAAALLALAGTAAVTPWLSAKPIAEAIAAERKAGDRVLCYGVYLHGLAFYTRAPVDVANWVGELHYAKRDPANAGRFGDDETIRALPDDGHRAFVAFRSKEAPWLTSLARPGHLLRMRGFGPWALAEFSAPKQGR